MDVTNIITEIGLVISYTRYCKSNVITVTSYCPTLFINLLNEVRVEVHSSYFNVCAQGK